MNRIEIRSLIGVVMQRHHSSIILTDEHHASLELDKIFDSFGMLNFVCDIEKQFNINLPSEFFYNEELQNIGNIEQWIFDHFERLD